MPAAPAPLTHKLILVVLCLNLVCLASLVIREYRKDLAGVPEIPIAEAVDGASGETKSGDATTAQRSKTVNYGHRSVPTNRVESPSSQAASNLAASAEGMERSAPEGAIDRAEPTRILIREPVVFAAEYPAFAPSAGQLGGVAGRVTLLGTPPPEISIPVSGAVCGELNPSMTTRHYVVSPDGGLANVLVFVFRDDGQYHTISEYLAQDMGDSDQPSLPTHVVLDQVGCMFEPYVLAMHRSQTLHVLNSDPVMHNIHLTPRLNQEKNFGQLQGQVNEIHFDKPEAFIRVKCDVRSWMFAYISVAAHPYFAVTDTNGIYRIPPGLPAGKYGLGVAHLKATQGSYRQITIDPAREVRMDFPIAVPIAVRRVSAEARQAQ